MKKSSYYLAMKSHVRRQMMYERSLLSQEEVIQFSTTIKETLFSTQEFIQATSVCFYVSYGNEVVTHEMIRQAMVLKKMILIPCCDMQNKTLELTHVTSWDDLSSGAYGILEIPKEQRRCVDVSTVDLILVPGVAFDRKGNRLGQGGGYYDRLLQKTHAFSIGVCFHQQLINQVPTHPHDKTVDMIITHNELIRCST